MTFASRWNMRQYKYHSQREVRSDDQLNTAQTSHAILSVIISSPRFVFILVFLSRRLFYFTACVSLEKTKLKITFH